MQGWPEPLRTAVHIYGVYMVHIRCICSIFGRDITKYTVIYDVIYGSGQPTHMRSVGCALVISLFSICCALNVKGNVQ